MDNSRIWLRQMLIYRYTELIEKIDKLYGIAAERKAELLKRIINNEWIDSAIDLLPTNKITEIYKEEAEE